MMAIHSGVLRIFLRASMLGAGTGHFQLGAPCGPALDSRITRIPNTSEVVAVLLDGFCGNLQAVTEV